MSPTHEGSYRRQPAILPCKHYPRFARPGGCWPEGATPPSGLPPRLRREQDSVRRRTSLRAAKRPVVHGRHDEMMPGTTEVVPGIITECPTRSHSVTREGSLSPSSLSIDSPPETEGSWESPAAVGGGGH